MFDSEEQINLMGWGNLWVKVIPLNDYKILLYSPNSYFFLEDERKKQTSTMKQTKSKAAAQRLLSNDRIPLECLLVNFSQICLKICIWKIGICYDLRTKSNPKWIPRSQKLLLG